MAMITRANWAILMPVLFLLSACDLTDEERLVGIYDLSMAEVAKAYEEECGGELNSLQKVQLRALRSTSGCLELFPDHTFRLRYQSDASGDDNQGEWHLDEVGLHLSVKTPDEGVKSVVADWSGDHIVLETGKGAFYQRAFQKRPK